MKRQNKKRGFTIIELVIVVAVIAILSAVLIPTFSAVIKRSRESADQSAVRNMNTVLASEVTEKPTSITEVNAILAENGIEADNYKPLYADRFFFWDASENVIVYTDADYKVLYPANQVDNTDNSDWVSLSGKIKEVDIKDVVTSGATSVAIDSAEKLVAVMDAISEGANRVEDITEITLSNDINLMGANFNFGAVEKDITLKAESEVEIKGFRSDDYLSTAVDPTAGLTEYGHGLFAKVPAGKTVKVENVKFVNAIVGDTEPTAKNSQFGFVAGVVEGTLIVNNVSFENCVINGCQKVGLVAGHVQGNGSVQMTNVTATNCTVSGASNAARAIGCVAYGNTVTATGCDFSGVTVKAATGATWTELWSYNGVADKNWNGTDLTTADIVEYADGFYAKYGSNNQLWSVYANMDYWTVVSGTKGDYWPTTTKISGQDATYRDVAKNF